MVQGSNNKVESLNNIVQGSLSKTQYTHIYNSLLKITGYVLGQGKIDMGKRCFVPIHFKTL